MGSMVPRAGRESRPRPDRTPIVCVADARRDRSARARRRIAGRGLGALGGVRAGEPVLVAWPGGGRGPPAQPTDGRTDAAHVLSTIARRLARAGEFLAVLDVRDGRLALDEAWQWFIEGGPRRETWRYRVTESGPSNTETRNLPADEVCHVRYAWDAAQPWRGASPAAFAANGAGLAGGIDATLSGEANGPSGSVMVAADLGGDSDDDDADPFTNMRADLAALRGGLTVAPTHKDALGLGPDAAPKSDYQSQRFGFAPPDSLEPIRRQALVDALGLSGVPAPLVDERSSAAAFREAARAFRETTLPALGAIIAEQVGEAIGQPDLAFAFPKQADVGVLSRAIGSLVTAGVPIEQAREIVGL